MQPSFPGYCNRCETHTTIKSDHHCSVCYQAFCEDCYYEEIYGDDLCNSCFYDMERCSKRSIRGTIAKLSIDIKKMQQQQLETQKRQGLLIALQTIHLENMKIDDLELIEVVIRKLIYNGNSSINEDNDYLIDTIERLSGINLKRSYNDFSVNIKL